jgi:hypothetical protein
VVSETRTVAISDIRRLCLASLQQQQRLMEEGQPPTEPTERRLSGAPRASPGAATQLISALRTVSLEALEPEPEAPAALQTAQLHIEWSQRVQSLRQTHREQLNAAEEAHAHSVSALSATLQQTEAALHEALQEAAAARGAREALQQVAALATREQLAAEAARIEAEQEATRVGTEAAAAARSASSQARQVTRLQAALAQSEDEQAELRAHSADVQRQLDEVTTELASCREQLMAARLPPQSELVPADVPAAGAPSAGTGQRQRQAAAAASVGAQLKRACTGLAAAAVLLGIAAWYWQDQGQAQPVSVHGVR